MKITSKRFLLTVLLLFCCVAAFPMDDGDPGVDGPPQCPCGTSNGPGASGGNPPPPVGECLPCPVPIDESIMTLVVIALVGGIYIIHRNNLKAKNPI
jgi:hypothetical protein